MAITAPAGAPAALKAGGATQSGPPRGIYGIEVTASSAGTSSKKGTPYLELELTVKNDEHNPSREGKKLLSQRFYFPHPEADPDKTQQMLGMLKRSVFKGFGVPWPKENKAIDPRVFVGKKAFVLLDLEKAQEGRDNEDRRMEVKRISAEREALEGALKTEEVGATKVATPKASTAARR